MYSLRQDTYIGEGLNLSALRKSGSFCRIATTLSNSVRERGDHSNFVSSAELNRGVFLAPARSADIVCR